MDLLSAHLPDKLTVSLRLPDLVHILDPHSHMFVQGLLVSFMKLLLIWRTPMLSVRPTARTRPQFVEDAGSLAATLLGIKLVTRTIEWPVQDSFQKFKVTLIVRFANKAYHKYGRITNQQQL